MSVGTELDINPDIKPSLRPDLGPHAFVGSAEDDYDMDMVDDEVSIKSPSSPIIGSRKASELDEPSEPSSMPDSKRCKTLMDEIEAASQAFLVSLSTQPADEDYPAQKALSPPPGEPVGSPEPELSDEQRAILDRAMDGQSLFFTGPAGTGKSVLLRTMILALHNRYSYNEVAVTASTGMAALNIEGCTLHSWAGIGLGNLEVNIHIAKIMNYSAARERWQKSKALVIDEVSMIHADLIDKLNSIGKAVRGDPRPFGGLQLIFCGDFFQLPPVTKSVATEYSTDTFAFDAVCWNELFAPSNMITLKRVFRQRDDRFVGALSRLRKGVVSDEDLATYDSCKRLLNTDDGVKPVLLYSRRFQVENENQMNLRKLPGDVHTFVARDTAGPLGKHFSSGEITKKLNDSTRFPEKLELKIGAQVMLVSNTAVNGYVNGSTGKVIGFKVYGFPSDAEPAGLDVVKDAKPDDKQAIMSGLRETSSAKPPAAEEKGQDLEAYPVVEFLPNRRFPEPRSYTIVPLEVDIQGPGGFIVASRRQVPLMLAWSMTIHKAQGMTLDRVRVDVESAFELGQVYVAISRVTSLEGLEIVGFDESKVMASQRVIEWTDELAAKQGLKGEAHTNKEAHSEHEHYDGFEPEDWGGEEHDDLDDDDIEGLEEGGRNWEGYRYEDFREIDFQECDVLEGGERAPPEEAYDHRCEEFENSAVIEKPSAPDDMNALYEWCEEYNGGAESFGPGGEEGIGEAVGNDWDDPDDCETYAQYCEADDDEYLNYLVKDSKENPEFYR